jgi:hypothetical protein
LNSQRCIEYIVSQCTSFILVYLTPLAYCRLFIVQLYSTESLKWVNIVSYQLMWRINERVTENFRKSRVRPVELDSTRLVSTYVLKSLTRPDSTRHKSSRVELPSPRLGFDLWLLQPIIFFKIKWSTKQANSYYCKLSPSITIRNNIENNPSFFTQSTF